ASLCRMGRASSRMTASSRSKYTSASGRSAFSCSSDLRAKISSSVSAGGGGVGTGGGGGGVAGGGGGGGLAAAARRGGGPGGEGGAGGGTFLAQAAVHTATSATIRVRRRIMF